MKIRDWKKTYHKMSNRKKVYSQRSISSSYLVLQRWVLRSWESDSAFMSPDPSWIFQVLPFPSRGKEGRVCLLCTELTLTIFRFQAQNTHYFCSNPTNCTLSHGYSQPVGRPQDLVTLSATMYQDEFVVRDNSFRK